MGAFITHPQLLFPSSGLPAVLQHIKPKMIASPQGLHMQLNCEAVTFMRQEMTTLLNGCEGVVVVEEKWRKLSVAAGVLSTLMDASNQTLSLTDCPKWQCSNGSDSNIHDRDPESCTRLH